MKHQQTFWRLWLSPRWISGVSTSPPFLPHSHHHPPNCHPPTNPSPLPIPPLFGWTSDPQHLLWRAVVTETQSETRAAEEGETCTKPFSWRSRRCWWEEDALRAAGGAWYGFHRSVSFESAQFALWGWWLEKTTSAQKIYFVSCCCCCCCSFLNFPYRLSEQVSGCSSVDFFYFLKKEKKNPQPVYNQVFQRGAFVTSAVIVVEHCSQFKDKLQKTKK